MVDASIVFGLHGCPDGPAACVPIVDRGAATVGALVDAVLPVSRVRGVRHTLRVNDETREGERQPPGGKEEPSLRRRRRGDPEPEGAGIHLDEYA